MNWKLRKSKSKEAPSGQPMEVTPTPSNSSTNSPHPSSTSVPNQNDHQSISSKSGILLLRLVEVKNLTLPSNVVPPNPHQKVEPWRMPYAVAEFDKNEVLMNSIEWNGPNAIFKVKANFDVSRPTNAFFSLYIRVHPPVFDQQRQLVNTPNSTLYLGSITFTPQFLEYFSDDGMRKIFDDWIPMIGNTGQIRVQSCFRKSDKTPLSIQSFDLLKVIGKGSFGKVMQVRKKDSSRIYALKILSKSKIVSRSEIHHTLAERTVLARLAHPFIVNLKFSFQTPEKLYLGLAFINGGELFHHLQKEGHFDENRSRFYAAELLSALECLHSLNVIYRDLKPENILLDYNGHIALCDFGLCKLNMGDADKTHTFCGTPEYLAPEVLYGQGYNKAVDWWTFGVLLYEMLTGLPPFYDENVNEMYRRILEDELIFPDDMSIRAKTLLAGLLNRNPAHRLGATGAHFIKTHPFFEEIDWKLLLSKAYDPPFKPNVANALDTSNFDEEFTSEIPQDSVADDSHLSETVQKQFAGFTYDGDTGMSFATSMSVTSGRSINGQ